MNSKNNDILTIYIHILSIDEIKGKNGTVGLIAFEGYSESEYFKGVIDKTGVDTQISYYGKQSTLSARYLLKGTDNKGNRCSIFIENNAVVKDNEPLRTTPNILTDSKELAWLETVSLKGELENSSDALIIHIYEEK